MHVPHSILDATDRIEPQLPVVFTSVPHILQDSIFCLVCTPQLLFPGLTSHQTSCIQNLASKLALGVVQPNRVYLPLRFDGMGLIYY